MHELGNQITSNIIAPSFKQITIVQPVYSTTLTFSLINQYLNLEIIFRSMFTFWTTRNVPEPSKKWDLEKT